MGSKNPIIYLTSKMWEYSKGNRHNVLLYFGLCVMATFSRLLEPLIFAMVIKVIVEQGLNWKNYYYIILLLCLYPLRSLISWACHGTSRVLERTNAFLVRANYKKFLLDGIKELSIEWHVEHHSGDTIDKIHKGSNALFEYASDTFDVISLFVRLIGAYIALSLFHLDSLYIVLLGVVIAATIIIKFDVALAKKYRELNRSENKIAEKIFDMISNINTVVVLRIEKLLLKDIWKNIMQPLDLYKKNNKVNELKWALVSFCASIMTLAVLGSYLYMHLKSGAAVLISSLYALGSYVGEINETFFNFAGMYGGMVRQRAAVANAEELADDFRGRLPTSSIGPSDSWQKLEIVSLNFSYHSEEGSDLHLDDISMTMGRGERIALIGESGSGKTTLLKVIRDLYHPKTLRLLIDNRLVLGGFGKIADSVALIPQDPEIFATTILENITFGVEHDSDYLTRFTDMACFTDVALGLRKSFGSSINEKGVNLSQGQKQRLALARGLMACEDKTIVLLDEPTSSVDFNNELKIYENIFKCLPDKTIISSIHRLHLLPMFDRIYFFDDGKIIASGTFDELLTTCSKFTEMWQKYNSLELAEIKKLTS